MDRLRLAEKGVKSPSGFVKLAFIDGTVMRYLAIRIGVTWPSSKNRGYFCVVGEEHFEKDIYAEKRGRLVLLKENEHTDLSAEVFCKKITDAALLYCASDIYCDFGQADNVNKFLDCSRRIPGISLAPEPYDDFVLGLSVLSDWDATGNLSVAPTSLVFDQLKITRADIEGLSRLSEKYPRLYALQLVVSGFDRDAPVKLNLKESYSVPPGHPQGWMI